MELMSHYSTYS